MKVERAQERKRMQAEYAMSQKMQKAELNSNIAQKRAQIMEETRERVLQRQADADARMQLKHQQWAREAQDKQEASIQKSLQIERQSMLRK